MTPVIRSLEPADVADIVERYSFPWSTKEKTQELWDAYYHEQQAGIRTVAVIVSNVATLGYGSLLRQSECPRFAAENIPEINAIWIDEPVRNQGLATSLIRYLENLAVREGYSRIGLGVGLYKDYGAAQRLYCKLGYYPDGHGITYKGQPTVPGQTYPLDDDLLLWLVKKIPT